MRDDLPQTRPRRRRAPSSGLPARPALSMPEARTPHGQATPPRARRGPFSVIAWGPALMTGEDAPLLLPRGCKITTVNNPRSQSGVLRISKSQEEEHAAGKPDARERSGACSAGWRASRGPGRVTRGGGEPSVCRVPTPGSHCVVLRGAGLPKNERERGKKGGREGGGGQEHPHGNSIFCASERRLAGEMSKALQKHF